MKYQAILLDADDTLFDFARAEEIAIRELLARLGIGDEAADVYRRINAACWLDFEVGKLTQTQLQARRFRELMAACGLSMDADEVGRAYLDILSRQSILLPGALEAVQEIAARLPIAIVTNGIARVQRGRIERSPIRPYVKALMISEEVGAAKPDPCMFFEALGRLSVPAERALMIGDSLSSDIPGANAAGVDACWYNPKNLARPAGLEIAYIIRDIAEMPRVALQ